MAFGNFGGLGASFPTRIGAPNSQQVMSDMEWDRDWQSRLDAIPKTMSKAYDVQLVAGAEGYDPAMAAHYKQQLFDDMSKFKLMEAGANPSSFNPVMMNQFQDALGGFDTAFANQRGPYGTGIQGGGYNIDGTSFGGSHIIKNGYVETSDNPAFQAAYNQYVQEGNRRTENQAAQQQAYNGMLGEGQKNAVIGPGYETPGFGQVNGQVNNPFATNPQGADMGWMSGMYNPAGTYGGNNQQQRWGL